MPSSPQRPLATGSAPTVTTRHPATGWAPDPSRQQGPDTGKCSVARPRRSPASPPVQQGQRTTLRTLPSGRSALRRSCLGALVTGCADPQLERRADGPWQIRRIGIAQLVHTTASRTRRLERSTADSQEAGCVRGGCGHRRVVLRGRTPSRPPIPRGVKRPTHANESLADPDAVISFAYQSRRHRPAVDAPSLAPWPDTARPPRLSRSSTVTELGA